MLSHVDWRKDCNTHVQDRGGVQLLNVGGRAVLLKVRRGFLYCLVCFCFIPYVQSCNWKEGVGVVYCPAP